MQKESLCHFGRHPGHAHAQLHTLHHHPDADGSTSCLHNQVSAVRDFSVCSQLSVLHAASPVPAQAGTAALHPNTQIGLPTMKLAAGTNLCSPLFSSSLLS